MTLRHRLLLVYLIVALLSVATLGVAVYELNRTQEIYGPLLVWHDAVWDGQRLKDIFLANDGPDAEQQANFESLLTGVQQKIGSVSNYIDDVDYIRDWYIIQLRQAYQEWKDAPPEQRAAKAEQVNSRLDSFDEALRVVNSRLMEGVEQQQTNKLALSGVVLGMATLHILLVGWLLRRWLLEPMARLNRQVEALAKDQPPAEPLLTSPLEMARLAAAMDRARQSLQVYRQQLIDNERLTTIGQFAAQLAHNLRNPLASIRAAAQVTGRHERENDYVRERMDEVVACVDRLNHWVAGLMEVARRDPAPTGSADVVPLLHRIHEAVKPDLAIKELVLAVEAPEGGLVCAHDPATLEQALIAMVVNAIEASPLGKGITLRAEQVNGSGVRVQDQSEIGNPQSELASVCRISVNDEGSGLPVDDPERIFEFSYSTKQKGMGLGLALARLALERQGGQAHACNRPEGGAMVYVDLPVGGSEKRESEELGAQY
jgi:signal transduction histidine kinase